jgi:hypothetical protein
MKGKKEEVKLQVCVPSNPNRTVGLSMASERFLSGSGFALWVSEADGAFDGAVGGGFGGGRVVVHLVSAL